MLSSSEISFSPFCDHKIIDNVYCEKCGIFSYEDVKYIL